MGIGGAVLLRELGCPREGMGEAGIVRGVVAQLGAVSPP